MTNPKAVVVLGKFDGVHIAHTKLILTAVDIAGGRGHRSLVYSMQKSNSETMTSKDEKVNIIKALGVDEVVFRELDEDFMSLSAKEFVENILKDELGASCVVVGDNFRFGKNRSADAKELRELCNKFGIDVVIIDLVYLENEKVSSTLIKRLLSEGNVALAKEYLGRPFSICGTICEGKHLGRRLGFPTVNIYPQKFDFVPKHGVYATHCTVDGIKYPSITNVGVNPTVDSADMIKAETHIFAKADNWYGKKITVEFLDFIRPETQFENIEELQKQVDDDKKKAKEIHGI